MFGYVLIRAITGAAVTPGRNTFTEQCRG